MVSEETKTKVIERINSLEGEVNRLNADLNEELNLNNELEVEMCDTHTKLDKYKSRYLFEKKLNSNLRKFLIAGSLLFGATFFTLGYLVGTKPDNKYQPVQQQIIQPQVVELKKEPEQKKYNSEMEEILDKAFEKYK